jgi:hypothetical protein
LTTSGSCLKKRASLCTMISEHKSAQPNQLEPNRPDADEPTTDATVPQTPRQVERHNKHLGDTTARKQLANPPPLTLPLLDQTKHRGLLLRTKHSSAKQVMLGSRPSRLHLFWCPEHTILELLKQGTIQLMLVHNKFTVDCQHFAQPMSTHW